MKKSILLILMFITVFFAGSGDAWADETKNNQSCIYMNLHSASTIKFDTSTHDLTWFSVDSGKTYFIDGDKYSNKYKEKQYYWWSFNLIHNTKTWNLENHLRGEYNSCPLNIYLYYNNNNDAKYYYFYETNTTTPNHGMTLSMSEYTLKPQNSGDETIIQDCESFIDEDLMGIINTIMNIIRIAVPIMLIGLITYDFAMGIFAGDDKAVNKAKTNAIRRVIIAVVIFFVPTLINFVFNIVNEIWATNFEICGIAENN